MILLGKDCPRYFVQNPNEWIAFKNKVAEKLNKKEEPEKEEFFEMAKTYKNGSSVEPCYKDCNFKTKTGSLDKWETCECLGIVVNDNNQKAYIVKYKINGANNYAVGFVAWHGGVK